MQCWTNKLRLYHVSQPHKSKIVTSSDVFLHSILWKSDEGGGGAFIIDGNEKTIKITLGCLSVVPLYMLTNRIFTLMLFDEICCVSQNQLSLTLASHKEKVQQAMTTPYHQTTIIRSEIHKIRLDGSQTSIWDSNSHHVKYWELKKIM